MQLTRVVVLAMVTSLVSGHAIPIWEMLPRHEKMGQIMYSLAHLVDQTCAYSYIPDCHHVLTLHGLSNLVNMNEYTLNRIDPFQSDAQQVIWDTVMRGVWDLPPAYLPYYLRPQGDEMSNEIDHGFPSSPQHQPQPSSPAFLYPYAAIPNALNKPVAAVSDPHPYAVKVTPPPGFSNTPEQKTEDSTEVSDNEVSPEDRFASWSDSEAIVGNQQAMEDEFESWSDNSDVIVGNQEPVEDIYASWSDAEMIVSNQRIPEDRFAGWSDSGVIVDNEETSEDRFASWSDSGLAEGNEKIPEEDMYTNWSDSGLIMDHGDNTEDRFASWSDSGITEGTKAIPENIYVTWSDSGVTEDEKTPEDMYANWSDSEVIVDNKEDTESLFASWSNSESSNTEKQTETADRYESWSDMEVITDHQQDKQEDIYTSWTESDSNPKQSDRYVAWSDSEAGLSDAKENLMPAGIKPTANFEPVMVESRVVVSRVAPPTSFPADQSTMADQHRRKRNVIGSLLPTPLPLLRH